MTTNLVKMKPFRPKAEGVLKTGLTHFGKKRRFLHQTLHQNVYYSYFPNSAYGGTSAFGLIT